VGVGIQGHSWAAFPVVRAPVSILQEAERSLRFGLDWYGEGKILLSPPSHWGSNPETFNP